MIRRRSSPDPLLGRAEYLQNWSRLHSNIDPSSSRFIGPWLHVMYTLGRPLAQRSVSPHTVTIIGVAAAMLAVAAAIPGSRWPLFAAALILISAVLDGVDGAVAVVGRAHSPWGYVLDTVADRCSDLAFLAAAFLLGAPAPLVVATGALTLLQESARARATAVAPSDVTVLTVWERPSRVITAVVITGGAGIVTENAALFATVGSAVALALAIIGFAQLMFVLFRRLH